MHRHASLACLAVGLFCTVGAAGARAQEASAAAKVEPYTQTIPGTELTFDMVPIPGGTFVMGSPEDEEDRNDDEGPQISVKLEPFWMSKCEVTWDMYDEFAFSYDLKMKKRAGVDLDAQPEGEKAADALSRPTPPYADETFGLGREVQPVICITHHAAMEFCRWLSLKTGELYRLPTEAEWEYACRAGTTGPYSFEADEMDDYAWLVENAEKPMEVGTKKPNPWGLHDMHGNVAEWCLDHYAPDTYKTWSAQNPVVQPVVLPDAKEYPYVARGGSWDDDPDMLRSAARRESNLDWSVQDPQRPQSIWWHTDATFVGFRIVRPVSEQENLVGLKSQVVKGPSTK